MKSMTNLRSFSTLNLTFTGGLGVLGGLWLIVSPYLFDYNNFGGAKNLKGSADNATLLGLICGIITILISVFLIATEKNDSMLQARIYAGISLVLMGVLLLAAPYLFNYSMLRDPLWNLQLTGAIFVLIAGYTVQELATRRAENKS
jgi:hypothetical protein